MATSFRKLEKNKWREVEEEEVCSYNG
jgi:hypothetical protein